MSAMPLQKARNTMRRHSPRSDVELSLRRLNFSFVLHEPSTSPAVGRMANAIAQLASINVQPRSIEDIIGVQELSKARVDLVLTAQVGHPSILSAVAARLENPPAVVALDGDGPQLTSREFFRATAQLALPTWSVDRAVFAAVVARPGGDTLECVVSDVFTWPHAEAAALRAAERAILAYVDQWRPRRALWGAPAEVLLPEVLDSVADASLDTR